MTTTPNNSRPAMTGVLRRTLKLLIAELGNHEIRDDIKSHVVYPLMYMMYGMVYPYLVGFACVLGLAVVGMLILVIYLACMLSSLSFFVHKLYLSPSVR